MGLLHLRRICTQVSFSCKWQTSQLGLGYLVGQKRYLWIFPMYCLVQNFSNCLICPLVICGLVQNVLESLLSMLGSFVHLLM